MTDKMPEGFDAAAVRADGQAVAPIPAALRHDESEGDEFSSDVGDIDPSLAMLVEAVTRRIQDGEGIDIREIAADNPAWAEEIRQLIPALQGLARLGGVVGSEPALNGSGLHDREGRRVFGDFHIDREIGRGGMGVVYEAEQVPLGRRVALKVLLAAVAMDPKALQRFQLEAQVAGLLQHPRIVPVHSVGTVGEVPYFAMQLIEGGSLADLLIEIRGRVGDGTGSTSPDGPIGPMAAGLLSGRFVMGRGESEGGRSSSIDVGSHGSSSADFASIRSKAYIRTVVRLGIQAADALGYAHDQGITHRDIKPANLLIDIRGDLWVADFGMADVQGDVGLTMTGDLPGTLRYMSPEQAMGKRALVDRRTDVYSLGVTLYELLTLRPAIAGADRQEIFRRIAEEEPTPIRQVNPSVPVDLATILAKATAKEPGRRYDTAGHLAEDLARFLDGRPISARPVGPMARGWRWCRRKPMLAGLAASLALALTVGLGGMTWSWREAVRQRGLLLVAEKEARRQAGLSQAINRFLINRLLGQASPENNPEANRVTLLEVLNRASAEVGSSFEGEPETEASIRMAIGRAYHGLGENARSEVHFRSAMAVLAAEPGDHGPLSIAAKTDLGHALCHLGRLDEAGSLLTDAFEEGQRRLKPGDPVALSTIDNLADFESTKDHQATAEDLYRQLLREAQLAPKLDKDAVLTAFNNLGVVLTKRGKTAEAEALYRRLIGDSQEIRGLKHPGTLSALNNLATLLEGQGKLVEAETLFRRVTELNREVLGPSHPGLFASMFNLAHVLASLGRADEAEALFRKNLEAQAKALVSDHPTTLRTTSRFASLLRTRGRLDEAEAMLRPCLDAQRRVLGPKHADTIATLKRLDAVCRQRAPSEDPSGRVARDP